MHLFRSIKTISILTSIIIALCSSASYAASEDGPKTLKVCADPNYKNSGWQMILQINGHDKHCSTIITPTFMPMPSITCLNSHDLNVSLQPQYKIALGK